METQQQWRLRFSFRSATILVSLFNLVTAFVLLHGFFSRSNHPDSVQLKYIKESEEIRRAMQPLDLIRRVREIEQESYTEPQKVQQKETRQTAALDLSKRLNNFRSYSDAASIKALEEWRKRKMERARQRELGKNGTSTT